MISAVNCSRLGAVRLALVALAVLVCGAFAGCSPSPVAVKNAHAECEKYTEAYGIQMLDLLPEVSSPTPTTFNKLSDAYNDYYNNLTSINLSACPQDYRSAMEDFIAHIKMLADLASEMSEVCPNILSGEASEAQLEKFVQDGLEFQKLSNEVEVKAMNVDKAASKYITIVD